jgi:hypothetical protein
MRRIGESCRQHDGEEQRERRVRHQCAPSFRWSSALETKKLAG